MSYPTLEQYNEAFQHPHLALTDPELKLGSIATTGLGLPLALCGGFALTYTIKNGTKKHAVRCFHKQSNALEKRYISISSRLKSLRSPYFVDFEFQPQGVRVAGKSFPIVKMAWASGTTLGEFLERNHRSSSNLLNLRASLQSLAKYLESQGMAHGDVQPGNVMVADAGNKVQLIDYDGIFVEELKTLGSSELGHRNFQHPKRASSSWNATLDRFSFISLDLAIRHSRHTLNSGQKHTPTGTRFSSRQTISPIRVSRQSLVISLGVEISQRMRRISQRSASRHLTKPPPLRIFLPNGTFLRSRLPLQNHLKSLKRSLRSTCQRSLFLMQQIILSAQDSLETRLS